MDIKRFDAITRVLTTVPSRRMVLRGIVAAIGGVAARWLPGNPDAESRHHRPRKKPVVLNIYGCVDVGKPCRGRDDLCCSGICQGKKPKKGKPDRSRCVAHHVDICQLGQLSILCGGSEETTVLCTLPNGQSGLCDRTTGNASYCVGSYNYCLPCKKDSDCHDICGAGAACITCTGCAGGTTCVGLDMYSCIA